MWSGSESTQRVRREDIDRPACTDEIGEREVEVSLREQQPVVEKDVVAKERVEVDKQVERQRETVGDRVRKERVEVDEDVEYRKSPAASMTEKGADERVSG